ncbi:UNVERIFIED_CONTAM: Purine permease 3, partial [Sesamum angustifolium]
AIEREAKGFGPGEERYYIVVGWSAIVWQDFFLGAIGVIFYSSLLFSSILISVLLPAIEVLSVIFYHENVQVENVVEIV